MKRRPRLQVVRKRFDGCCLLCSCADYESLQCHRIVAGADGGKYLWTNSVTLCANCHAKVTAGTITIVARRESTFGPVIECVMDGERKFIREDRKWK